MWENVAICGKICGRMAIKFFPNTWPWMASFFLVLFGWIPLILGGSHRGGAGSSVLDANYPPQITVGRRPPREVLRGGGSGEGCGGLVGWLVGWLVVQHGCGGRCPPPPRGSPDGPMPRQWVWVALSAVVAPPFLLPAHSLPTLFPCPPTVYSSYPLPLSPCPVPSPVPAVSLLVTPSHHHRT